MTHHSLQLRSLYAPEPASLLLLAASTIVLIGLQHPLGWLLLLAGVALLYFTRRDFARHIALIYLSIAILGITPINTDTSPVHMLIMGALIGLAVALPYLISRFVYKTHVVRFRFIHGKHWLRPIFVYAGGATIAAYFLLPFYLTNTGAYLNWTVEPGLANITAFFIGTNALGIWDELFFINTAFAILRIYLPFWWANVLQAVLFTSFLYELGFIGWGVVMIFLFALAQGYIFKKTESLLVVIAIHLVFDLVLFLAIIEAHQPNWLNLFIT